MVAGGLLTFVLLHQAPQCLWMLPGLWCVFFSLGVFASYRLLPRATFWVAFTTWRPVLCLMLGPARLRPVALGDGPAVRRRPAARGRHPLLDPGATHDEAVNQEADEPAGRFAYEGLDRVIHEKARLGIITSLATHPPGLLFNDLKELCSLTDGNLSRHLQILSEAGLVQIWKGFKDNRPQTLCQLSDGGPKRFLEYIAVLENVVTDALGAAKRRRRTEAVRGLVAGVICFARRFVRQTHLFNKDR